MHGDFLSEVKQGGGKLIGGLALLSGYINKVRQEEEKVVTTSAKQVLEEYLRSHQNIDRKIEGRLIYN